MRSEIDQSWMQMMQVGDNFYWTGVTPKVSSQELFFWWSGIWKHAKLLSTIFSILDVAMKFSDCICMNRLGRRIGSCVGLKCSWRYHTHAHSPGSGGPTSVLLFFILVWLFQHDSTIILRPYGTNNPMSPLYQAA